VRLRLTSQPLERPLQDSGQWFAAWDLAFRTIPFALIDPEFAEEQLFLMLFEQFQHPSQIPAYEWEFSDLKILQCMPGLSGTSTTWTRHVVALEIVSSSKNVSISYSSISHGGQQG